MMTSRTATTLHVVVPNNIDDPASPSGGNRYDREACSAMTTLGWHIHEHQAHGSWPSPSPADLSALDAILAALPPGAPVLIDGLVASSAPHVLSTHAARLRLFPLVHMPFGDTDPPARPAESRSLLAARSIIATSEWTARRLTSLYGVPTERIRVATPGIHPAPLARSSPTGAPHLLCVAVVARHKGHDVLARALPEVAELPWTLTCAGALDRDPGLVASVRATLRSAALTDRVTLAGPVTGPALDALYSATDLLVHPSRGETYGMVAAEALARGIPVLATTAKGLPDAIGRAPDRTVPGLLVPADDPAALATTLRQWLTDAGLRARLRASARARRETLTDWSVTARTISDAVHATDEEDLAGVDLFP